MPIHPSAIIDPSAEIDATCAIGPYVRIGANCQIGPDNEFMDGAIVGPNTVIGKQNKFHYHAIVGHDPQYLGFDPATKSGTIIGNGNHFREFCQVHRGLKDGQNTIIGNENFFMATSHVAHDCHVGSHNVMANGAGMAGHVTMGDRCFVSIATGIHQFCRVGSLAMLSGLSSVTKDVPPYTMLKGINYVVGLNVVGLRRMGVPAETRKELRNAYKLLFRSGKGLGRALEELHAAWKGRAMPAELQQFVDFCSEKSKRGLCRGPRRIDRYEFAPGGGAADDE